MATKKKRLANSLRENSDGQASWGNKVRAPKVSDKGNAMVEVGRNKAAHSAGQSTVSTRARYVTAVSKNRRSGSNTSRNTGGTSVNTQHENYLRSVQNNRKGVYTNGKSVKLSTKTKENPRWELDLSKNYSKNHKTLGAYSRRSAAENKAQFNGANWTAKNARRTAWSNSSDENKEKIWKGGHKSGDYARGKVTDKIEQGGLLGGDARYSSFYTSETGAKYSDVYKKRKRKSK